MLPRATVAASTRSPRSTRATTSPRHTRTAKQPRSIAFRASIESSGPTGQWPHLFLPPEASAYLGKRGAVRVIVRVGAMSFRRAAKPDGNGGHFILFNADMRERTGKETGDRVMVGLELDRTPQELEVPREFAQMMHADGDGEAAFKTMPPSHRRGYLEFIEDAKRPEARARPRRRHASWRARADAPLHASNTTAAQGEGTRAAASCMLLFERSYRKSATRRVSTCPPTSTRARYTPTGARAPVAVAPLHASVCEPAA